MNEITITRDDFRAAIAKTVAESMNEEPLKNNPEAGVFITMSGIAFSNKMEEILFKED